MPTAPLPIGVHRIRDRRIIGTPMTFEKKIIGDCTLYRGDCLELLKAGTP